MFAFPPEWTLAGGPNLDVRDVRQSDSAFVLVKNLPPKLTIDRLTDEWLMDVLFDPAGKYGQYGVSVHSPSSAPWRAYLPVHAPWPLHNAS